MSDRSHHITLILDKTDHEFYVFTSGRKCLRHTCRSRLGKQHFNTFRPGFFFDFKHSFRRYQLLCQQRRQIRAHGMRSIRNESSLSIPECSVKFVAGISMFRTVECFSQRDEWFCFGSSVRFALGHFALDTLVVFCLCFISEAQPQSQNTNRRLITLAVTSAVSSWLAGWWWECYCCCLLLMRARWRALGATARTDQRPDNTAAQRESRLSIMGCAGAHIWTPALLIRWWMRCDHHTCTPRPVMCT